MTFYAIEYPYGLAAHADTGERYGTYNAFNTRQERDQWVADGPSFSGNQGFRQVIRARDHELRALLRRERSKGYNGHIEPSSIVYPSERETWDSYVDSYLTSVELEDA